VSWDDLNAVEQSESHQVSLPLPETGQDNSFSNNGIQKAILLTRYALFIQQYLRVRHEEDLKKLMTAQKEFSMLHDHFCQQALDLKDPTLKIEVSTCFLFLSN